MTFVRESMAMLVVNIGNIQTRNKQNSIITEPFRATRAIGPYSSRFRAQRWGSALTHPPPGVGGPLAKLLE